MEDRMKKSSFYDMIERFFSLDIPGVMTVLMGAVITTEVLGRLILNRSWQGVVDMAENLVVLLAFLSLAGVQAERGHITVDIVTLRLKKRRGGPILDCFNLALGILVTAFVFGEMVWYTIRAYSTGMTTVTLFWPVWPFAMGMALGAFLFFFRMVLQFKESYVKVKTLGKSEIGADIQP